MVTDNLLPSLVKIKLHIHDIRSLNSESDNSRKMAWFSKIPTITCVFTLRACQPSTSTLQRLRMLSLSACYHFEDFLDKEFEKAQRDLDTDALDDPGALLQKLERDHKRRILATKRARTARLFWPPKEPRSITWDTMEQIRYLKQEYGDEWTIRKLAANFNISEALVIKVLKSKFVPAEKRRTKQDVRAKVNTGLLPEKTSTVSSHTRNDNALLSAFSKPRQKSITAPVVETPVSEVGTSMEESSSRGAYQPQKISLQRSGGRFPSKKETVPNQAKSYTGSLTSKAQSHQHGNLVRGGTDAVSNLVVSSHFSSVNPADKPGNAEFGIDSVEKRWHSRHANYIHMREDSELGEKGIEEEEELNIDMENLASYADETPPPRIIQKGNEFFDENGEFLYRL